MTWRGLAHWLSFWGIWPALLMILCQVEATYLLDAYLPANIALLTFAGTATIYGLDRTVEHQIQQNLAFRHQAGSRFKGFMIFLLVLVFGLGLTQLQLSQAFWLLGLGFSGLIYLLLTWGVLPQLFCLKELVGAWCFTLLVWGSFSSNRPILLWAFFLLGFANFLQSSIQDQERDHANKLRSSAIQFPKATQILAKASALGATGFLFHQTGLSPFFLCALGHAVWPLNKAIPVDWAFLPMVSVFFRFAH